jgi:hypothetical protein
MFELIGQETSFFSAIWSAMERKFFGRAVAVEVVEGRGEDGGCVRCQSRLVGIIILALPRSIVVSVAPRLLISFAFVIQGPTADVDAGSAVRRPDVILVPPVRFSESAGFSTLNDDFTDTASACTTSKTRIAPSTAISMILSQSYVTMVCSLELSTSEKGTSSSSEQQQKGGE